MKQAAVISILITLLMFSAVSWNCSSMGDSIGGSDEIIVFADSLDWPQYKDALNEVFGKYIQTPIMEREFFLHWVPFRRFDQYKKYKNIFFLGVLDSKDPVSVNVQNLLNPEIIAGVETGKYFYIPKKDVWAMNQYVVFFVAKNPDDMIQKTIDLGDLVYKDFKTYYYQRLKKEMFANMEQKDLEKYIADHFPFTMRVQHDYFIANESSTDNFVWIRRLNPDRSILVHWQPVPENFQLTPRWVISERNRMAKEVFSGDVIVEDETHAYSVDFKGWQAVRLEGTWKNDSLMIGGPFRDITFIDRDYNRIYMLDYYVQAIGKRKIPFLNQLDVIIHTFEPQKQPAMKPQVKSE